MKNGILNFLHSFVIVAVFACISCSHQRNISDGGLSTNALEGAESGGAAPEENSGDQAVMENHEDLEVGVVASNEPTTEGDTALIVPEDGSKESDILIATNDTPVQLMPPSESAEGSTETMSEATPSAAEIAAAVSEQTGTEEQITPAPAAVEKKPKKVFKKRSPATKIESKNEVPARVHSEPVPQPAAQAPARPVQDPFRSEDEEEVRPEAQQAGAGIAGFIEQNAFWVASAIVGFILCLFFFAKRKKATDDGYNL